MSEYIKNYRLITKSYKKRVKEIEREKKRKEAISCDAWAAVQKKFYEWEEKHIVPAVESFIVEYVTKELENACRIKIKPDSYYDIYGSSWIKQENLVFHGDSIFSIVRKHVNNFFDETYGYSAKFGREACDANNYNYFILSKRGVKILKKQLKKQHLYISHNMYNESWERLFLPLAKLPEYKPHEEHSPGLKIITRLRVYLFPRWKRVLYGDILGINM